MTTDPLAGERRSALMRSVRRGDTTPEIAVRKLLHAMGVRFRLHRSDLPGTPDIVLASRRTVIFVHGCFWHRHEGCAKATLPKTRADFWTTKFLANVARDADKTAALRAQGWKVLVVWECEIRDRYTLARRLAKQLGILFKDVKQRLGDHPGMSPSHAHRRGQAS